MSDALNKLVSNASAALDTRPPSLGSGLRDLAGAMADPLLDMLGLKNGFYAFESALHVLPSHSNEYEFGLDEWNSGALWRHEYGKMVDGCLFFAEDVFGGQF